MSLLENIKALRRLEAGLRAANPPPTPKSKADFLDALHHAALLVGTAAVDEATQAYLTDADRSEILRLVSTLNAKAHELKVRPQGK